MTYLQLEKNRFVVMVRKPKAYREAGDDGDNAHERRIIDAEKIEHPYGRQNFRQSHERDAYLE